MPYLTPKRVYASDTILQYLYILALLVCVVKAYLLVIVIVVTLRHNNVGSESRDANE